MRVGFLDWDMLPLLVLDLFQHSSSRAIRMHCWWNLSNTLMDCSKWNIRYLNMFVYIITADTYDIVLLNIFSSLGQNLVGPIDDEPPPPPRGKKKEKRSQAFIYEQNFVRSIDEHTLPPTSSWHIKLYYLIFSLPEAYQGGGGALGSESPPPPPLQNKKVASLKVYSIQDKIWSNPLTEPPTPPPPKKNQLEYSSQLLFWKDTMSYRGLTH